MICGTKFRDSDKWPGAGQCKLALLAIEFSTRTKTYDTASWASIMKSGLLIEDGCVAPTDEQGGLRIPLGGNVLTGQLDQNLLGS